MSDRRLAALGVSVRRRQRLDDVLHSTLAGQREQYAAQAERCGDAQREVDEHAAALRTRTARLNSMMIGSSAFSLDSLNDARRYLELVDERYRASIAQLERLQADLERCAAAMSQTCGKIAANRARIGLVKKRAQVITRELEVIASDAVDDETQETAVSRLLLKRMQRT